MKPKRADIAIAFDLGMRAAERMFDIVREYGRDLHRHCGFNDQFIIETSVWFPVTNLLESMIETSHNQGFDTQFMAEELKRLMEKANETEKIRSNS